MAATTEDITKKLDTLSVDSAASPDSSADSATAASSTTSAPTSASSSSSSTIPSATVLKSTDSFTTVHPLSSSWTLWFIKPPTGKNDEWKDLLTEIVTFSSVEEFWGAYNNLNKVSQLPLRSDYALFKTGIRPEWEDAKNSHGGKVVYSIKDHPNASAAAAAAAAAAASNPAAAEPVSKVDEIWLGLLLGLVGGTLDLTNDATVAIEEQKVNGVFVNVRKAAVRFNLWTKDLDVEKIQPIANRFKEILKIEQSEELEFSPLDSNAGRTKKRAL